MKALPTGKKLLNDVFVTVSVQKNKMFDEEPVEAPQKQDIVTKPVIEAIAIDPGKARPAKAWVPYTAIGSANGSPKAKSNTRR